MYGVFPKDFGRVWGIGPRSFLSAPTIPREGGPTGKEPRGRFLRATGRLGFRVSGP